MTAVYSGGEKYRKKAIHNVVYNTERSVHVHEVQLGASAAPWPLLPHHS